MTVYSMNDDTERRLLANDPMVTAISWYTFESNPVAQYASRVVAALRQSSHVQWLSLALNLFDDVIDDFLNREETVIQEFVEWIKTSPALKILRLQSSEVSRTSGTLLFPVFVDSILSRNQQDTSSNLVSKVTLLNLDVKAEDLATLMRARGLEDLSMDDCDILVGSFPTEEAGIQHVVESFAENTSISILSLDVTDSNSAFFFAMLDGLQSKSNVTSLNVMDNTSSPPLKENVINALANLFNTTVCPLKKVTFDYFMWTEASMAPICNSLRSSPMPIEEITLWGGSMDVESCALLQSIFGDVISHLGINGRVQFPPDNNHQALQRLVGHCSRRLSGASTEPTQLSLFGFTEPEHQSQFRAILRGLTLKDCCIQSLSLLCNAQLEAVADAIPHFFSVRHLSFELEASMRPYKERLMTAFRNNHLLLDSIISGDGWDEADKARLKVYHQRNRALIPIVVAEAQQTSGTTGQHKSFGGSLLPKLFSTMLTSKAMTKPAFISFALTSMEDGIGLSQLQPSKRRVADLEGPQTAPRKRCKLG